MRLALIFLALIFLSFAPDTCIECEEFLGKPTANLIPLLDETTHILELNVYYENVSASPSRIPITNTILIVEMSNSTGLLELWKIYTDDEGKATFDFSFRQDSCINFRVLYCPFCTPTSPGCGFEECMRYANIETDSYTYNNFDNNVSAAADIPDALGASSPATLSEDRYVPNMAVASYCPPPPPQSDTPALCLPLIIVFSLLGGSLYLTGRNPFTGFNIGGARMGRHIRYQARGRGFHMNLGVVVSAISTISSAIKTASKEGGSKELAKQERERAGQNVFGASAIGRIDTAIGTAKQAGRATSNARDFGRAFEAMVGQRRRGGAQQTDADGRAVGGGGLAPTVRGEDMVIEVKEGGKQGVTAAGAYFGTVFASLGNVLLFALTQTIVGRTIGSYYSLCTGRSMTEDMFADHSERLQNDTAVLAQMIEAEGGIEINGHTVTGVRVERDADGNAVGRVFVVQVEGGEGVGEVAEGRMEIVTNTSGQVVEVRYNTSLEEGAEPTQIAVGLVEAQGPLPEGQEGPLQIVQAEVVSTHRVEELPEDFVGPPGLVEAPNYGGDREVAPDQSAALRAYNAFAQGNTDLALGTNAGDFIQSFDETHTAMNNVLTNIRSDISEEIRTREQNIERSHDSSEELRRADEEIAGTEVSLLLRVSPGDREAVRSGFLGGPDGPATEIEATQRLHEAGSEAFGGGGDDEQFTHFHAALGSEVAHEALGSGDDRNALAQVSSIILGRNSVGDLENMTVDQFREQVQQELTRHDVNAEDAQRIANSVTPDAFQQVNHAVTEFREELRDHDLRPELQQALFSVPLSEVSHVAEVGHRTDEGNMAPLYSQYPAAMGALPEEMRQEVREYNYLQNMSQSFDRTNNHFNNGNFQDMQASFGTYNEQNSHYVETVAIHTAYNNGMLNNEEYQLASRGSDNLVRSYGAPSSDRECIDQHQQAIGVIDTYMDAGNFDNARAVVAQQVRISESVGDHNTAIEYSRMFGQINLAEQYHNAEYERQPGFEGPARPEPQTALPDPIDVSVRQMEYFNILRDTSARDLAGGAERLERRMHKEGRDEHGGV
ncbi:hypothetical protein KKB44_03380 [Candidatus Micrarchaeota archaeon]|nr:hypothetical protein [Candidatus Micrarchaeota archaeon]